MRLSLRTLRALILPALATASVARAQSHLYDIPGETTGIRLGTCVAPAGDFDGDGVPDFLSGSHPANLNDYGLVQIFSGRTGAQLHRFRPDAVGDGFGVAAACLGDVDGDGVPDYVIGAPRHITSNGEILGRIYGISGRTGAMLWRIDGGTNSWGIGRSIAVIGDVDHDGIEDFAEGATWVGGKGTTWGSARVFSGRDGSLIYTLCRNQGLGGIGSTVAGPGDVDGDGVPDILVGEPFRIRDGSTLGIASLYSGRDGTLIRAFVGRTSFSQFGAAVAGCGDVDGDGHPDLVVGAPGDSTNGSLSGSVSVYSGANGSLLRRIEGDPGDRFGDSVSGGGDVDGDGIPDLAVGAPGTVVGGFAGGVVHVFSGRDGSSLAVIPCQAPLEGVGPCAMLGDLNGDGLADIAVGAPNAGDDGPDSGSARVYLLGHLPPTPYCQWKWNSQNCGSTPFVEGAASLSLGDGMFVHIGGVLNRSPGFLVWGLARAHLPFGGGVLCVQPLDHGRVEDSGGNPNPGTDCTGTLGFRFTASTFRSHGLGAGTRIYCQFLSRDSGFTPPNNVGLSQALAFIVLP